MGVISRVSLLAFVAIIASVVSYSSFSTAETLMADNSAGEKIYRRYCGSCHGTEARGDGVLAKVLNVKPANLREISKRRDGKFPKSEIAAIIDGRNNLPAHGESEMPVWGQRFSEKVGGGSIGEEFTRGQLYVLVEYLESIQD